MTASELRRVLRAGDLGAVTLSPGTAWLPVLRHAREAGAAILPVDVRLTQPERAALIAAAHPTVIADEAGVRRHDGVPIDAEVALVIATSGTSGQGVAEVAKMGVKVMTAVQIVSWLEKVD